jgi:hypothetical protein
MFLRRRAESANTTILPSPPVSLTPSGHFDGNDGRWSTFIINIGDDGTGSGQNLRILPATSSSITQVPVQAGWCSDAECAQARGIEVFNSKQPLGFESSSSKAWEENGLYNLPLPYWWKDSGGSDINGTWGSDNVGLGPSSTNSKILQGQMVVETTSDELYMGSFGLAILPVDTGGGARTTFLDNFAGFNQIPSKSYGYTAGASYRTYNLQLASEYFLLSYVLTL